MNDLILAIRREASRILREGIVKTVIGFETGTLPLKAQPTFINSQAEVEKLVLNGFCQNNLAVYLTRRPKGEPMGIICRGCESRSIRVLITEHQYSRDKLYLIGVPCTGVLDWRKVESLVAGKNVVAASEEGDQVIIFTASGTPAPDASPSGNGEHRFQRSQMLHDSCARCLHPNPIAVDIILGEPVPEGNPEGNSKGNLEGNPEDNPERAKALPHEFEHEFEAKSPHEFEAKSPIERFAYFARESERCIRCYACREACPMCYCTQCFVDYTTPRWAESTVSPAGIQSWHIMRAFHQTGRCVSCGACERACPMDIKMIYLTEKLNDDMRKLYGFEAGMREEQPPLATFSLDDRDLFSDKEKK